MRSITAHGGAAVDHTTDIETELPNAIFTLLPSTMMAVLKAASVKDSAYFLCKKFQLGVNQFNARSTTHTDSSTTFTLTDGRLFVRGNNSLYQSGNPAAAMGAWLHEPQWIRLPPVTMFHTGCSTNFAQTTHGLYTWGSAIGHKDIHGAYERDGNPPAVQTPTRVDKLVVDEVMSLDRVTFFRAGRGDWSRTLPREGGTARVPGSADIFHWVGSYGSAFGVTEDGLVFGLGRNRSGQLGLPRGADLPLTPIPLKGEVAAVAVDVSFSLILMESGDLFMLHDPIDGTSGLHKVAAPGPVTDMTASADAVAVVCDGHVYLKYIGRGLPRTLVTTPDPTLASPKGWVDLTDTHPGLTRVVLGPGFVYCRTSAGWLVQASVTSEASLVKLGVDTEVSCQGLGSWRVVMLPPGKAKDVMVEVDSPVFVTEEGLVEFDDDSVPHPVTIDDDEMFFFHELKSVDVPELKPTLDTPEDQADLAARLVHMFKPINF